jgi:cytochrome P450
VRSLSYLAADFTADPWPTYRRLRLESPVWWADDIQMVCTFGYEETRQVLTGADFTVEYPFRISEQVFGRTLLDLDGPEHRRLRNLVTPLFTRSNVERIVTAVVAPAVDELVSRVRGREQFDFMAEFAEQLPVMVACSFVGLARERFAESGQLLGCLLRHLDGSRGDFEQIATLRRRLEAELDQARQRPREAGAFESIQDLNLALTPEESLRMMMLMLAAGVETSVCALGNALSALLRHPTMLRGAFDGRLSLSAVIAEAFRWEPPQHDTVRFARMDTCVAGVPVRQGQAIKAILASGNRDERVYSEPDEFRPGRTGPPALSFGYGAHMCLGRRLAALEVEHLLAVLFAELTALELETQCDPRAKGHTFRRPSSLVLNAHWK